jgi:hypothetical protein
MRHQLGFRFGTFIFLACSIFGQDVPTAQPLFSASPTALQQAFSKLQAGTHPVTILLEDWRYEYDSAGMQTFHYRMIFKVTTKAAAENWAMIERTWAPWKEQRPSVAARVISKDGTVHELDPKTIAESPVRDGDDDVLTDRRMIRAPLPAIESDSLVEEEIVTKQTVVPLASGTVDSFYFGNSVPVQRTIVTIRVPIASVSVQSATTPGNGRVWQNGSRHSADCIRQRAYEAVGRCASSASGWWAAVAAYRLFGCCWLEHGCRLVFRGCRKATERLQRFAYLPKFAERATRDDKILAIVSFLNKEIRYTGVEFSEASFIPHKPTEVLARKYGDCMEKGFDHDGAVEAYRKALELDPSDNETRANLAILLEYNHAGFRYGAGSSLEQAIAEYARILDKLAGLGVGSNYAIAHTDPELCHEDAAAPAGKAGSAGGGVAWTVAPGSRWSALARLLWW